MAYALIIKDTVRNKEMLKIMTNDPAKFKGRFKIEIIDTRGNANTEIRSIPVTDPLSIPALIDRAIDEKFTPKTKIKA